MKIISNGWRKAILLFLSLLMLMSSLTINVFATDTNHDGIDDDIGKFTPGYFSWQQYDREWGARVTLVDAVTGEAQSLPIDYTRIERVFAHANVTSFAMNEVCHFGILSKSDYRANGYNIPPLEFTGYMRYNPPVAEFEDGTKMTMPCTLNGSTKAVSQDKIEKYFSNDKVIKEFSENIGMDVNEIKSGKYKFLVEPIVYLTRFNQKRNKWFAYAFTPTEMSMYTRIGKVRIYDFGSKNMRSWAKSLFLEKDDIGYTAFRDCSDFNRFQNAKGARVGNKDYETIEKYLGMMTITFAENPVIHTYDIINKPKDPAPAEPPTDLTKGDPVKGDITIVKLYMNAWKDGSGKYMGVEQLQPNAVFTQSNTTNSIVISDETGDNKPGYNVVSWYVSTEAPKTDLKFSDWVQFTKGESTLKDVLAIPGINGNNGANGLSATQYYPVAGTKNGTNASSLSTGNYNEKDKKYETTARLYDDAKPLNVYQEGTDDTGKVVNKAKTLYVLYEKVMPYIKTSDKPSTPTGTTNPEDPDEPTGDDFPNKQGNFNIVKVYGSRDEDTGEVTNVSCKIEDNTTYCVKIMQEGTYKLYEYAIVNEPAQSYTAKEWCNGFNKSSTYRRKGLENAPSGWTELVYCKEHLPEDTKTGTIYLLYLKNTKAVVSGDIITESYVAKRFKLGDKEIPGTSELFKSHEFKWNTNSLESDGWTLSSFTDGKLKFVLTQSTDLDMSDGVVSEWTWPCKYSTPNAKWFIKEETRTSLKEHEYKYSGLEYVMVLYRKDDHVSLIDFKNNYKQNAIDLNKAITKSGGDNMIKNKESSRQDNGKNYKYTVNLTFTEEEEDGKNKIDLKTKAKLKALTSSGYVYTEAEDTAVFDGSTQVDWNFDITYHVYKGTQDGTQVWTPDELKNSNNTVVDLGTSSKNESGLMIESSEIEFRPYIRMQYDKHDIISDTKNINKMIGVNVLGEYKRAFKANDYVGVTFAPIKTWTKLTSANKHADGLIKVYSSQWSTHAEARKWAQNDLCVLPGGAVHEIAIAKDDRQEVNVSGYFTVLTGTGLTQVKETGGNNAGLPEQFSGAVQDKYKDFLESVKLGLETLNVQQYVADVNNSNVGKPVWEMTNAQAVDATWAAAHTSNGVEDKYYFRDDNDNTSTESRDGDLDVEDKGSKTTYYTFFTNTRGEIRYKKASVAESSFDNASTHSSALANSSKINTDDEGTVIVPKNVTTEEDLKNAIAKIPEIKRINDRTHIVERLFYAVLRGKGNDKNAVWATTTGAKPNGSTSNDGKWYNEAFDGITIAAVETKLLVGFNQPVSRECVLDPHLIAESKSKNDFFKKYKACQYSTKDYCGAYIGTKGKIGEFDGTDIIIDDLNKMFLSDIFFIPNVTVQDLR